MEITTTTPPKQTVTHQPLTHNETLIFIVAYNHENYIEKVINRIPKTVLENPRNEVLVIDDGSHDQTFYVTDEVKTKLHGKARLTVLKNPLNQGYGGNQKLGYRYAIDHGFQRVVLVHGDGQYAPELVDQFIQGYASEPKPDAVFGTRMHSLKSARAGGMPYYKIVGNRILTILENYLLGSQMSEFHSGFRSYSTALLKNIPFEANSNDFHFDTEIIIQAHAAGGKILELPIPTHYGDEICHVNGVEYALNVVLACLHYRIQQLGFLYDRKFDVQRLQPKPSRSEASKFSFESKLLEAFGESSHASKILILSNGFEQISNPLRGRGFLVDVFNVTPPNNNTSTTDDLRELEVYFQNHGTALHSIVFYASFEQLMHPERLLEIIRRTVKHPGPRVFITTANVGFFITRFMHLLGEFNYGIGGILDRAHMRLFTKRSLKQVIQQAGYKIDAFSVTGMPWSYVLKSRHWAIALEKIFTKLANLWHGFFAYEFIVEAHPLPTPTQLLSLSNVHSEQLREMRPNLPRN